MKHKKFIHCYQSELESYGASGPDGIPSQLLKELFTYIATVFVLIFNALLHQGKFPLDWKTATVVLIIRKAVTLYNPSNYRPIYICYKVFEHVVSSAISQHAYHHNKMVLEKSIL